MATIKDVAEAAGVSVATVSRVLNQEKVVAPETAKKVKNAIRVLDYSPNMLGNSLRKSCTKNVLVLLPTLSNQFFSKVLRGIEEVAKQDKYNVMICVTESERAAENKYLSLLKTRQTDGVIFLSSTLPGKELTKLARKYPVVQCCEYIAGADTSYVAIDNEKAGYDAVNTLIRMGYRKIAFVGASVNSVSSEDRKKGYIRALKEAGLPLQEEYILSDSYSFKSGKRSAAKLIALSERPTAVFAVADSIALGLMRGFSEQGCRIPEDIAVIGFDDIAVASFVTPTLSTVSQPQIELGQNAMRLLLNKIRNPNCANQKMLLAHDLILRETV